MKINNLPETYNTVGNSNLGKLIKLLEDTLTRAESEITKVLDMVSIETAAGYTLDLYGVMLGQSRGNLTDEQYRKILLLKSSRNNCKGTYDDVVTQIAIILDCNFSEIVLNETGPAQVSITQMPLQTIVDSGLSASQILLMIQKLLPAGVRLSIIDCEGTFEFSDNINEESDISGFADDELENGGYFGLILGMDNETILPI